MKTLVIQPKYWTIGIFLFASFMANSISAQSKPLNILVIGAHPDDADLCAGGTAILWAEAGHHVKFLSLTNGDAGHQSMGGGALAKRRRGEAHEVADRLGIDEYEVLDNHDGELLPSLDVRLQVIRRIRQWKADIVILPRPNDYHPDHRNTGLVVQDAAYMVIVPNVASDTPPLTKNPVFLYCRDRFQKPNPFEPQITVDIDAVFEKKINGLDAHVSQFYEWLPWTAHALDQVPSDTEDRKQWLGTMWSRDISDEIRMNLEKWYGKEEALKTKHAEAFEVCEYGTQPDDQQIRDLFPMLPKSAIVKSSNANVNIKVDGILDEPLYQSLHKYEIMNSMTGRIIEDNDYRTYFQVFHDDEDLYLAFTCYDRDIFSTYTQRDEHLWKEEVVEVFIDTDDNPNTYFEIEVSPANVLFDSYIVDPKNIDLIETPKFDFQNLRHGVFVKGDINDRENTDEYWTVEMSIPLSELVEKDGKPLKIEEGWNINFYRINSDASKAKYLAWRPTFGSFHQPFRFGTLIFE